MLVADVGQRVLEARQALAAPPAEDLLQPVRDQHRTEADPQDQQAQMLGAATAGGAHPLVVEVMLVFVRRRRARTPSAAGGLRLVGQRLLPVRSRPYPELDERTLPEWLES